MQSVRREIEKLGEKQVVQDLYALTRALAPHYAGVFMLHLTLTAAFIAVPHVLRDLHGIDNGGGVAEADV